MNYSVETDVLCGSNSTLAEKLVFYLVVASAPWPNEHLMPFVRFSGHKL